MSYKPFCDASPLIYILPRVYQVGEASSSAERSSAATASSSAITSTPRPPSLFPPLVTAPVYALIPEPPAPGQKRKRGHPSKKAALLAETSSPLSASKTTDGPARMFPPYVATGLGPGTPGSAARMPSSAMPFPPYVRSAFGPHTSSAAPVPSAFPVRPAPSPALPQARDSDTSVFFPPLVPPLPCEASPDTTPRRRAKKSKAVGADPGNEGRTRLKRSDAGIKRGPRKKAAGAGKEVATEVNEGTSNEHASAPGPSSVTSGQISTGALK